MHWEPETIWAGREAFVIGGGSSLKGFDFSLLENELTVGVNDAYQFGPEICNICIFGDQLWLMGDKGKHPFDGHFEGVKGYVEDGGFVVTNDTHLETSAVPWIHWMRRRGRGLHRTALGWNQNTGASAINLALILGATTVYLLGFDRFIGGDDMNWHPNLLDGLESSRIQVKPGIARTRIEERFAKMNIAEERLNRDLSSKFPEAKVVNLTDGSKMNTWPKVSATEFWKRR